MTNEEIVRIDAAVRARFVYTEDGPVDTWRSHLSEVTKGESWKGDCDDLTSTVLNALAEHGMSLSSLYRLLVSSTGNDIVDHMVGCVVDQVGNWWIVGDTLGGCYNVSLCSYKILRYNLLSERDSEGAVWREGAPFS